MTTQAQERSLYQRLGECDALAAVTDDFIGRLAAEPQCTKFFSGFSIDSKKRLRQHLLDQLCEATGGPCMYMGRSMKVTHAGLGLTDGDWTAATKHLTATLENFQVPEKEKREVLAFVTGLKPDIVEK
jgi:hemoglobin